MVKLFWTPEAIQDRDDIYAHIEADNPVAALALDELFSEEMEWMPPPNRTGGGESPRKGVLA